MFVVEYAFFCGTYYSHELCSVIQPLIEGLFCARVASKSILTNSDQQLHIFFSQVGPNYSMSKTDYIKTDKLGTDGSALLSLSASARLCENCTSIIVDIIRTSSDPFLPALERLVISCTGSLSKQDQ